MQKRRNFIVFSSFRTLLIINELCWVVADNVALQSQVGRTTVGVVHSSRQPGDESTKASGYIV